MAALNALAAAPPCKRLPKNNHSLDDSGPDNIRLSIHSLKIEAIQSSHRSVDIPS